MKLTYFRFSSAQLANSNLKYRGQLTFTIAEFPRHPFILSAIRPEVEEFENASSYHRMYFGQHYKLVNGSPHIFLADFPHRLLYDRGWIGEDPQAKALVFHEACASSDILCTDRELKRYGYTETLYFNFVTARDLSWAYLHTVGRYKKNILPWTSDVVQPYKTRSL